jgi:ribosomal protein S18 acetylase RimI-like enzyme
VAVTIEKAQMATDALVDGLNVLLAQLSSSASSLRVADVELLLDSDATTLFVALDENEVVVGMLSLVIFEIPSGRRAWIEDVVVDEGSRGLGVGEQLTRAAIEEAGLRDVRSIDLTSRPSREAANALYQKLGFQTRETNVYRFFLENE